MEATNLFFTDIQKEIFSYKPPCELKLFLSGNPEYKYLFSSEDSLIKIAEDYGLPYYKGITLDDLCKYSIIPKSELLSEASELGDLRVVSFLTQPHKIIEYKFTKDDYNIAMSSAAKGGHVKIIDMMLELGAKDYNLAMISAAREGHIGIVDIMLELGADKYGIAMLAAAGGGHIEIVKMMLELGADNYNKAMISAAMGGHVEIVKMMLEEGADNYNWVMGTAAYRGHTEIVDLIKSYM